MARQLARGGGGGGGMVTGQIDTCITDIITYGIFYFSKN